MKKMLPDWYGIYKGKIEEYLDIYLSEYFSDALLNPGLKKIKEGVFYSLQGGKKIRSILALEFYLLFSGKKIDQISNNDDILKFCISLEIVHAYSLIHDDLPCMDNDEFRRGQETVWKKFGETNGVLIGDLLNSLSFEIISEINSPIISQKLTNLLSKSVGFHGMLGGQIDDIYFEENFLELEIESLELLHNKKTGALITASIIGGILLSGKDENIEKFNDFGGRLGLAFQIKDDLLDVEGTFEETGKSIGGEEKGFVYFLGIEKSQERLEKLLKNCKKILGDLHSEKLEFLVDYVGNRKK